MKRKKPKKVGTGWIFTRSQTFKPKKGPGSFKRRPKHEGDADA